MSSLSLERVLPPIPAFLARFEPRPLAAPGPVAGSIVLVYATCALLGLAYPQALAAWLEDFEPNPAVAAAQAGVDRLAGLSERLGLAPLSDRARDLGRHLTRKAY